MTSPGWRHRVLVLVLACATLGNVCDKPDWVTDLERSVDVAVPQLEDALDKLAKDLPAAVDKLDANTADRLRELDATLRDAVDGLNYVLEQNQGRLDAALAARVRQLTKIATALAADVNGIARGITKTVSASVTVLLAETRAAADRLLVELGAQVAQVSTEGDHVVAGVYSEALDLIVRVVGVALLVIGVIGAGLIFATRIKRRTTAILGVQAGLAAIVIAAGVVLVLSAGARRKLVRVEPVIVDHRDCSAALSAAASYLGTYAGGATPEAVAEASQLMPRVASCLVMAGSPELVELAQLRLQEVRRLLGIARACVSSTDCAAGLTCDVASGACIRRCEINHDCLQGELCHPAEHACGPPCNGSCPGTGTCQRGSCVAGAPPLVGPTIIDGGRGWSRVSACNRDARCLQIIRSSMRFEPLPHQ